jgi:hypothetical protein
MRRIVPLNGTARCRSSVIWHFGAASLLSAGCFIAMMPTSSKEGTGDGNAFSGARGASLLKNTIWNINALRDEECSTDTLPRVWTGDPGVLATDPRSEGQA